ncbi:hypothetical protein [Chryseolinea lacunae]|uniref:Uncharacterized protein n=1 Tax=Chryseolinea lacunae TaxID=2801331 RepID=A0ABS1KKM7_9BACT|nr:hypothetical protein [Chryseolinea lacunae]MBL0739879.1 hypothetical protein [Chryseolinea lacunae]
MKRRTSDRPLVKITKKTETLLYLLREELKCRKLFAMLEPAGFNDNNFQPHLDELILRNLGISPCSDDAFVRYSTILDKHAKRLTDNTRTIAKRTLKAYIELMNERESLIASKH